MRQNREGVTEIIDALPRQKPLQGLPGLIQSVRWTMVRLWFLRLLACVWLAKGLIHWAFIVGANPRADDFLVMPLGLQGAIVFFAVADLLCAVGLWLAAAWGGAVWLITSGFELASPLLPATSGLISAAGIGFYLALGAGYFGLGWLATRENE